VVTETRLDPEDLAQRLSALPGWTVVSGRLHKTFDFGDFAGAFTWMTAVALWAEKADHHPKWTNVYATVEVELWSHDVGGITERDLELARTMNRLATP
jgi:4a-hydroxytetrahydrobiopterin dehydratase